jgi:hypothetical protein
MFIHFFPPITLCYPSIDLEIQRIKSKSFLCFQLVHSLRSISIGLDMPRPDPIIIPCICSRIRRETSIVTSIVPEKRTCALFIALCTHAAVSSSRPYDRARTDTVTLASSYGAQWLHQTLARTWITHPRSLGANNRKRSDDRWIDDACLLRESLACQPPAGNK